MEITESIVCRCGRYRVRAVGKEIRGCFGYKVTGCIFAIFRLCNLVVKQMILR